jgi:hypothetical protein
VGSNTQLKGHTELKNRLKKKKLDERVIRINNSINLDKEQI